MVEKDLNTPSSRAWCWPDAAVSGNLSPNTSESFLGVRKDTRSSLELGLQPKLKAVGDHDLSQQQILYLLLLITWKIFLA